MRVERQGEAMKKDQILLNEDNSKNNLEDRITYILSEWLDPQAPLGSQRYRPTARAVIKAVKEFNTAKKKPYKAPKWGGGL
jgi:hypothetical protein